MTAILQKPQRAVVAMSGGVDSSVAALLLKEQGYEVIGISMKLWEYNEPDRPAKTKTCCAQEDIDDARSVAARIGIPFYAVNYTEEFKEKVIAPFVDSYLAGQTPNPCVLCNLHIKFDYLLERAALLDADILATGHYAQVNRTAEGRYRLLQSADDDKDQTYFLFTLGQKELAKVQFPVGHLTKAQVREIALDHGFCTAKKHESQEICFVPKNDHADFIRKWQGSQSLPALPGSGKFINSRGDVMGTHEGIYAYTVGQRRGINIGGNESRHYVTRINAATNTITLGTSDENFSSGLEAHRVHWVDQPISGACQAKIRHRHRAVDANVTLLDNNRLKITFNEPQRAVTPGQAVVLYQDNALLGGGWITEAFPAAPPLRR